MDYGKFSTEYFSIITREIPAKRLCFGKIFIKIKWIMGLYAFVVIPCL